MDGIDNGYDNDLSFMPKMTVDSPSKKKRLSLKRVKIISAVMFPVVLGIFAVALATVLPRQNLDTRSKAAGPSGQVNTGTKTMRVFEIVYKAPNSGTIYLERLPHMRAQFPNVLNLASRSDGSGTANIGINYVHPGFEINGIRTAFPNDYNATYREILNKNTGNLSSDGKTPCQLIQDLDVDQVWIWVDSTKDPAPGKESTITYPGSNLVGWPIENNLCDHAKPFITLGFDYSQTMNQHIHSYGHLFEIVAWDFLGKPLLDKYTGVDYENNPAGAVNGIPIAGLNLSERCGSIHVPPNVPLTGSIYAGYQYLNTNVVNTSCTSWSPDQSSPGAATQVSSSTWLSYWNRIAPIVPSTLLGVPDEESRAAAGHTLWWLQNMPGENNGLTNQGRPLPNWWDLVMDLDVNLNRYFSTGFWLEPTLQIPGIVAFSTFSSGSGAGTINTWNHGGESTTLGVSTASNENGEVLQASTGRYVNMAIMTASYRSPIPGDAMILSATFCGQTMTRVDTKSKYGVHNSEMWYLLNPPVNQICPVVATFDNDPGTRILASYIMANVDSLAPFGAKVKAGLATQSTAHISNEVKASLTGPKASTLACTLAIPPGIDPERIGVLTADPSRPYSLLYKYYGGTTDGMYTQLANSYLRKSDNENMTLRWSVPSISSSLRPPWALNCANINVNPALIAVHPPIATPTPTPNPTPTPPVTSTPTPTPVSGGGPILFQPQNHSTLTNLRPEFAWSTQVSSSGAPATGYTFQLSTSATFGSYTANITRTTPDYPYASDLAINKKYYWRVRAKFGSTNGPFSSVYDFTTGNPPNKPALNLPTNGGILTDATSRTNNVRRPRLSWTTTDSATITDPAAYDIQVARDSAFTDIVRQQTSIAGIDLGGSTATSIKRYWDVDTNLVNATTYYWRVRATGLNVHKSSWSSVFSFKVTLATPVISAPANNSTPNSLMPTFDWNDVPGATSYSIYIKYGIGTETLLKTTTAATATVPSPSTFTATTNLQRSKLVTWRVRANSTTYGNIYSATSTFTTPNPPNTSVLSQPATGVRVTTVTPLLQWSTTISATILAPTAYDIQISTTSDFATTVTSQSITGTQVSLTATKDTRSWTVPSNVVLARNTTYYWRVRAKRSPQLASWSSVFNFKTPI